MTHERPDSDDDSRPMLLHLPARSVPPPDGASTVLRDALAADPRVINERMDALGRVPLDEAGWLEFIEADHAAKAAAVQTVIEQSPVSVERDEIGGVTVYHVVPDDIARAHEDQLFVHVHGGAYVLNGGLACVAEAIAVALGTRMRAVSIDYRMAPHHPYPAAVDDVVASYQQLLTQRPARSMAMGGSSAGGGITLSAVQRLIEQGTDVPGALFLGTPGSDLTGTGDTIHTNEGVDRNIPTYEGMIEAAARLYAGDFDLADRRISPIYGRFDGFPPTLLASGTRDLFLSNTVRTHTRLRESGAEADLLVYEGVSHADYIAESTAPESQHFLAELDRFLARHLRFPSRPAEELLARMRSALDQGLGSARSL